jgi:hypothetical protein
MLKKIKKIFCLYIFIVILCQYFLIDNVIANKIRTNKLYFTITQKILRLIPGYKSALMQTTLNDPFLNDFVKIAKKPMTNLDKKRIGKILNKNIQNEKILRWSNSFLVRYLNDGDIKLEHLKNSFVKINNYKISKDNRPLSELLEDENVKPSEKELSKITKADIEKQYQKFFESFDIKNLEDKSNIKSFTELPYAMQYKLFQKLRDNNPQWQDILKQIDDSPFGDRLLEKFRKRCNKEELKKFIREFNSVSCLITAKFALNILNKYDNIKIYQIHYTERPTTILSSNENTKLKSGVNRLIGYHRKEIKFKLWQDKRISGGAFYKYNLNDLNTLNEKTNPKFTQENWNLFEENCKELKLLCKQQEFNLPFGNYIIIYNYNTNKKYVFFENGVHGNKISTGNNHLFSSQLFHTSDIYKYYDDKHYECIKQNKVEICKDQYKFDKPIEIGFEEDKRLIDLERMMSIAENKSK